MEYCIDELQDEPFGFHLTQSLNLIVKGEKIFCLNYAKCAVAYEEERAKKTPESQGFFKVYGTKESPTEEIADRLREDTKWLYPAEKRSKVYRFSGNHEEYSGAFCWLIWDPKIVKQVRSALKN